MERKPAVYILASKRDGVLYAGVTSDLVKRAWQHRSGEVHGFSHKYNAHHLVYYELHDSMQAAILREKQMAEALEDRTD